MKLSEYGTWNGIKYRAAWNRFSAGKIEGAYPGDESGHVVALGPIHASVGKAAIYARVSAHKQKDDLEHQAELMVAFANTSRSIGGQKDRHRRKRHPLEADRSVER